MRALVNCNPRIRSVRIKSCAWMVKKIRVLRLHIVGRVVELLDLIHSVA